jgi:hypothetical protein
MKFLKPYKGLYIAIQGNVRVITLTEDDLKVMSMAYDELRFVTEGSRRSFPFGDQTMDELLSGIKERKAQRINDDDY